MTVLGIECNGATFLTSFQKGLAGDRVRDRV